MVFSIEHRSAARRTLAILTTSIALFMGLMSGTAAAAGPQERPEVEPMVACGPSQCMIMYSHTNHRGSQFHLVDTSANGCVTQGLLGQPVTSYDNRNSRLEGRLYAGSNCNGTIVETVRRGSQSPNIGGIAVSFRVTCISCREEG